MSQISATVTQIKSEQNLNIVTFDCEGTVLKMMSLELPKTIVPGKAVQLLIKPTAVAIGKDIGGILSYSNKLPVTLQSVEKGSLLTALKLKFHHYSLEAIITKDSFEMMQLQKDEPLTAFIKASELAIKEVYDAADA